MALPDLDVQRTRALRGSTDRANDLMEQFQDAYVCSVVAAAGAVVSGRPAIDEGVDLTLTHRADSHIDDGVARLEVQLKSTAAISARKDFLSIQVRNDRFNYLATKDPSTPKILVAMHVPESQEDWVRTESNYLKLHHHCFWINLDGFEPVENTRDRKTTVRVPTIEVFDDLALCKIMQRIGQGGKP